jgi:hypothetical protein
MDFGQDNPYGTSFVVVAREHARVHVRACTYCCTSSQAKFVVYFLSPFLIPKGLVLFIIYIYMISIVKESHDQYQKST